MTQYTESQLREALVGLSPAEQDQLLTELEKRGGGGGPEPDFSDVKSGVSTTAPHSLTDDEEADLRMTSGLPQRGEADQDLDDMMSFIGKTLAGQAVGAGVGAVGLKAAPYAAAAAGETLKRLPIVNSAVRGLGFAWDKFKKEREARKVLERLNRLGPTAEEAARTEAQLAAGTAPARAGQRYTSPTEPPSVAKLNRHNRPVPPERPLPPPVKEEVVLTTSPLGARQRIPSSSEPSSVSRMNASLRRGSSEAPPSTSQPPPPPPAAPPASSSTPPAQPPPKSSASRLGTPQTGAVPRSGPTTAQAAALGNQAKAVIGFVKAEADAGASPPQIVQSLMDMGVRADVAKAVVEQALKVAPAVVLSFADGLRNREQNRKAQDALRSQAQGVVDR